MKTLFHLAFPVHDFALAKMFYKDKLGCRVGRESEHALIFQLGSHQIVAHKIEMPLPAQQGIYPRHFGLIFLEKHDFMAFIKHLDENKVLFEFPLKTRFSGSRIEHQSFILKDPSNNILKFKYYTHHSVIFGETEYRQIGDS